jgi:Tol biopolymer transport system component
MIDVRTMASTRIRCLGLAAALGCVGVTAPARADIFATYEHSAASPFSLSKVNVTTGAGVSLPDAVRTPGDELHPALSPDRTRLVFLAKQSGAIRVIEVNLSTGVSADLFNAFEAASDPPTTPSFSADGTKVITGRRLEHRDASTPPEALQATYTEIDVQGFPGGPFPKTIVAAGGLDSTSEGRTLQPTAFGVSGLAIGIQHTATGGPPGRVTVRTADGATTLSETANTLADPTVSPSMGVVVYVRSSSSQSRLVFRPLSGIASAPTSELPALVNAAGMNVTLPQFSSDGRYLAFVRRSPTGGFARLFVWDTATQLLLKPDGVDVQIPSVGEGAIALEVRSVLGPSSLVSGQVQFTLVQASRVGIIVQRIVGTTRVLGHKAPRLRLVGRVPLGQFKKGRNQRVRWNRRVNGRKLAPGRYLVTVRSVTSKGQVRDVGKPVRVRIR